QPSDPIETLARGGGIIGWVVGAPLVAVLTEYGATPVVVLVLVLSLFIITKTPPNRIGDRLRELYAYLFGAQLPDPDERAAKQEAKQATKAQTGSFGGLEELDLDDGDAGALPWWRRNKSQREE